MSDKIRHAGNLKLLGGRVCLDFVNTADWRGSDDPQEFLNTFQDLVVWSRHVDIITNGEAKRLSRQGANDPPKAEMVLNRAIEFREVIYRIFSSVAEGKAPDKEDLTILNDNLSKTMMLSQIIETTNGFFWDANGDKKNLDWILNPIIRSTADLLISDELNKVKKCADAACGWLFLDISRNRSRRWCDMKDCGNRAKATRFYKRKQISKADRSPSSLIG